MLTSSTDRRADLGAPDRNVATLTGHATNPSHHCKGYVGRRAPVPVGQPAQEATFKNSITVRPKASG